VAATLAGLPSVVVFHDSRTRELADKFGLPAVAREALPGLSLDELNRIAAENAVATRYPALIAGFADFYTENGWMHSLDQPKTAAEMKLREPLCHSEPAGFPGYRVDPWVRRAAGMIAQVAG